MLESSLKKREIKKLKREHPEAIIMPTNGTIAGIPDYVVFDKGECYFIEFKTQSELSELQKHMIERLKELGYETKIIIKK
jgi:Holliday junction resolvase